MIGPSVWLIAGPTASGKSGLALALALASGAEIVNADSMQIYADLSVLTARPSVTETARAPHHLDGVADGAEAWSVGRWLRAAEVALAEIAARGRPAIVVGGTGLYFRALTQGLADIPPIPEAERAEVEAAYGEEGEAAFRTRLSALDPAAADRIEAGDRQRLIRAMAVARFTGRALSDWQSAAASPVLSDWRGVVLDPPRETLYARCDARLATMVEQGAMAELERLLERRLDPALPVMKALGVPEFAAHLRGEATLDEALSTARQSTRRYAKRQTTWFRNQTADWPRLAAPDAEAARRLLTASR
jgi:tRNA dimethylallyltransferase